MIPTVIITSLIAAAVGAVIYKGIKNAKEGRHSCSCGGNCGGCRGCGK